MACGSTSGPCPVITPRASSLASRAWTVPRATPSCRATSSSPIRGFARSVAIKRASSESMVISTSLAHDWVPESGQVARSRWSHLHIVLIAAFLRGVFEEGQLYSPVSTAEDGEVQVHLDDDHPGANDPAYRARRNEIAAAALAWQPGEPAPRIVYSAEEEHVWRTVCAEIAPKHEQHAVGEYREALARVSLPTDRVPGLDEVTQRIEPLTGWRYVPAAGLVPLREFYGSLERRVFHSTQYVRHPDVPLYTPEPDILHEVLGHGHLLASPTFG